MIQQQLELTAPAEDLEVLRVMHLVRQHEGRAAAISMHEIERLTGIPARSIQSIVKLLVEERHLPIGTSTSKPFGYFWIVTEGERRECRNHLLRRALSTLRHAQALDSEAVVGPLVGQLELTVGDES